MEALRLIGDKKEQETKRVSDSCILQGKNTALSEASGGLDKNNAMASVSHQEDPSDCKAKL